MRVRRLPVVDEYVEDGEAAILVGDSVVVLSELATFALALMSEAWTDVNEVATELVDAFGPPPDDGTGVEATRAAFRALAEHALVEVRDDD